MKRLKHLLRLFLSFLCALLLATAFAFSGFIPSDMVHAATKPGGTWITPSNDFTIQGQTLTLSAHAYPTNKGDPKIAKVNFTATWPGVAWRVVCAVPPPSQGDVFQCQWNLSGVPNGASGPLTISFDVYDQAGNVNYAPNGLHKEGTSWTAPMRNWQVIGYKPGQGDHVGRDYWAVDLYSSNSAVYPTRSGTVVYAQWNCDKSPGQPYCYGYVVVIDHGNGIYSIYAHLAANGLPKVGNSVGTNTQIGTMSDSGCSGCGLHLHFASRSGAANLGANALFGSNTPVRTPW